jgi:hypothetical protein
MPLIGVLSAASMANNLFAASAPPGGFTLDESAIKRDARGLPRWVRATGASLLTPSDVDPGMRPVTDNSDAKPGDNIVPWYQWDDADYNWQIANERFHLPRGYEPPSLDSFVLSRPVITNTEADVKANAVASRRAAGIEDGDVTSTGAPAKDPGQLISTPTKAPGASINALALPVLGDVPVDGPFIPLAPNSVLAQEAGAGDDGASWLKVGLFFLAVMVGLFVFRSARVKS